jgi:hypothetical protein
MGRHDGWAVIVALVGGGQEIHTGGAGLAAWGDAIAKHPEWNVNHIARGDIGWFIRCWLAAFS